LSEFLSFALPGIPSGCAFALVAVGLVLTYRATGIFNFGFGAEAYAAAAIYAELYWHGVNKVVAALVVVLVIAPIFGAILDAGFFSRIPPGNQTAKIVTSLGVLVLLPQIVIMLQGATQLYAPPAPFFSSQFVKSWGSVVFNGPELSTFIATGVILAILMVALRTRSFGLPMRAAVESPKLLELNGVNSKWVIRTSWMVSTALAGLSGVLFASQYTYVQWPPFSIILVAAIAAAALAGLRSLWVAVVGGLALGTVQGIVQGYLPTNSTWYLALVPSLPFFILLAVLIFHPSLRRLDRSEDPMAMVEPPPPPPALALRPPRLNRVVHRFRWIFLALVFVVTMTFVSGQWIGSLTIGAALSVIFLSITLMTGIAGQLSLAQAAFAGIGACATAQLADAQHVPVIIAAVAGALVAGLGGVAASLPALRLRGLPIALLTLCLALLADYLLFPTSWIGGGDFGLNLARPRIFDIHMDAFYSKSFFIFVFVILLAVTGAVHAMLRGTTGRALSAVHASPSGAAASGVPVRRMTVLLFFFSAAIAGLGGALFAMYYGTEAPSDFNWQFGPTYLVIVVTVGVSTVEGAIEAGMIFALASQLVTYLPSRVGGSSIGSQTLTILALSLGAFTYASHPEGIIEFLKRKFALIVFRATPHEAALVAEVT
jgi:branched-subunit amino acid ABC-type transport system permease component